MINIIMTLAISQTENFVKESIKAGGHGPSAGGFVYYALALCTIIILSIFIVSREFRNLGLFK